MNARIMPAAHCAVMRRHQQGMSLVELMVALVIGAVLIAGAVSVYSGSKRSFGESETISRLQETARFAMSIIETDTRMANNFGLLKGSAGIVGKATQTAAVAPVAAGAALNLCGNNWAVDLDTPIQGDNDQYVVSASRLAGCTTLPDITGNAWTTTPVVTADTLTIRRAAALVNAGVPGALQICSTRSSAYIMNDGNVATPCALAPNGQINDLIVNTYYVDQNSQQLAGLPSLRRKTLTTIGGVAQVRDEEVIAGVEDMQVQFGIDTIGTTGVAQEYIDPVTPLPVNAQVVAVRIWLLVRADTGENGFIDSRVYTYGDRIGPATGNINVAGAAGLAYQPSQSPDGSFNGPQHARRLLISRTVMLRNAIGT